MKSDRISQVSPILRKKYIYIPLKIWTDKMLQINSPWLRVLARFRNSEKHVKNYYFDPQESKDLKL